MDSQARAEAVQRLRSIEGHIRGIQRLLEEDCSCVGLIRQTLAVRRALEGVSRLLVSGHLRGCLLDGLCNADAEAREQVMTELLDVLDLNGRA